MSDSNQVIATDVLLVKAIVIGSDAEPGALTAALKNAQSQLLALPARLQLACTVTGDGIYIYFWLKQRTDIGKDMVASLAAAVKKALPQLKDVQVSRLEKVFAVDGASAGEKPVFHYAVEMDPEAGWMPELSQWYDTEHMPGLATVPGCVQATRLLNHDHSPLSFACYELLTQETLGSPAWLAVRGTEWSSRMRPKFTNTIRTMFRNCD